MKFSAGLLTLGGLSLAAALPTNCTTATPKPKGKWFDRKLDDEMVE